MIAKIGYSYAVAILGVDGFKPIIVEAILNASCNVSYLVGMNPKYEQMMPGVGHFLQAAIRVPSQLGSEPLVVVEVRLCCSAGTPTYHAVVGKLESASQVSRMMEKLREHGGIEVPVPGT